VFVAPHQDSVDTVHEWLQHHGLDPHVASYRSPAGDWLTYRVTVAQAESMLKTKYNVYQHKDTGEQVVRTLSYGLPKELHSHIAVIAPTTYFGTFQSMRATSFLQPDPKVAESDQNSDLSPVSAATVPASCSTTITPACLRALYNTTDYVPKSTATNKLGVAGYLKQYASTSDLQVRLTCLFSDLIRWAYLPWRKDVLLQI